MSRQKTGERLNGTDFYPSPHWTFENMRIDLKPFEKILEPSYGDGRIPAGYDWIRKTDPKTIHE